jgi:hypothetical protein
VVELPVVLVVPLSAPDGAAALVLPDVLLPELLSFMPVELHAERASANRPPINTVWYVCFMVNSLL